MMLKYAIFSALLLSACHTPPVTSGGSPGAGLREVECGELDRLLTYQRSVQQMASPDAARFLADLNLQPNSAQIAIKKAMLLATLRGNGDLLRAQNLLDQLLKSTEHDAERLKPLAYLLNTQYGEWRRLDDSVEKLNQQVHEEQRRAEQLSDKLEALKNIERTLPARPGAAPAPASSAAPATIVP